MANRFCPWCGAPLKHGSNDCSACERRVGNEPADEQTPATRKRLSDMDAYKGFIVPTWLFAVIVALGLLGLVLIFVTAGN